MGKFRDFFMRKKQEDNTDASSTSSQSTVPEPVLLFTSKATEDLISAREALFTDPVNFWSAAEGRNIPLTLAQKQLQSFILESLKNGALARDAKLRLQTTEHILNHLIEHWHSMQVPQDDSLVGEPAPQETGYSYNPLTYVWRGASAVGGGISSLFYTSKKTPVPEPITSTIEEVVTPAFKANLIENFNPVIESIKRDQATDVEGLLKNWQARTKPAETQVPLSECNLNEPVENLKDLYEGTADLYSPDHFKDAQIFAFVKNACKYLNDYYNQLLILNTDLNPNNILHWRQPSVQNALDYYFEQRTYLYKIVSMVNEVSPKRQAEVIKLMNDYKIYIKDLYARNETFATTFGPVAFGYSKWEKIEAAMEQYRTLCEFPGDVILEPLPERLRIIRGAGEQGRLRELKGRGLFFHYQFDKKSDVPDPFDPLNMPTVLKPIPPHRNAYR